MSSIPDHCQFCDTAPVAGFNDVVFCADHVTEGIGEAARVLILAQGSHDPQRIAAVTEVMIAAYYEADVAIENDEMHEGDTITVNTHYDPRAN